MSPEEFFYTGLVMPNPPPVYEVYVNRRWAEVSEYIFRSWTGPRKVNGVNYNGDVYYLGSNNVAERS